jgi:hypothetical protein
MHNTEPRNPVNVVSVGLDRVVNAKIFAGTRSKDLVGVYSRFHTIPFISFWFVLEIHKLVRREHRVQRMDYETLLWKWWNKQTKKKKGE